MNQAALLCLRAIIECQSRCMSYQADNIQAVIEGKSIPFPGGAFAQEIEIMDQRFQQSIAHVQ